ncbi:MAG: 16S rRNA (adenine(1518)-N(6)/adenine(1519)-N(6))-dimethyltransferase RsmA [Planctomycetaceae bacterium]|nr:16S rRNA (adenine(1518)-N(6)/adenine(1519)-N(6))-dimethyltransferase RsmA [Planctomycetaceae bacterium]
MKKFEAKGINPQTRLGQNFLIDLNLLRLLYESGGIESNDVILEVGTGTGALTAPMSDVAAAVITVDVDPVMQELARQELFGRRNIHFLQMDILKNKNTLRREVLDVVYEELGKVDQSGVGRRFKLVANLPYCIATPLISNLLKTPKPPELMCVTIQKELADRITAKPNCKDWGALSIWTQSQCRTEIIRIMPPNVFWPRPKVDSAIVRLLLDAKRRNKIPDLNFFNEFSRAIFFHRRKFLRAGLCSAFKRTISKQRIDEIMDEMNLDTNTRAETLPLKKIQQLCELCRKELIKLPENERKILQ